MARNADSNLPFDAEDLAEVLAVLESSPYDELHIETERFRLTLRRGAGGWTQEMQALSAPNLETPPAASAPATPAAASSAKTVAGLIDVPSPMVGTFYVAPKPGAPPFVQVGSFVQPDTIIGIVEVMKLMNTLRAGLAGEVAEIVAANGVLIEQGQTILRVRPKK